VYITMQDVNMSPPLIMLFIPLFICIQISRRGEGRGREEGWEGVGGTCLADS
jgi:hypothetical protein